MLVTMIILTNAPPFPTPPPQALEADLLDKESLGMVNAYQPALTSTWMFQKSMSVGVDEKVDANLIVDLLANNFKSMDKVGPPLPGENICLRLFFQKSNFRFQSMLIYLRVFANFPHRTDPLL